MRVLRLWPEGTQEAAPACAVGIVDLPLVPGTFCGCRRHYCRQVALRVKLAGERPDRIFGGDQDEMGSVTFRSEQALEVDLDGSRKLRFEVLDEDQAVLAFAEIEAKDLARKARWRLLLSDPSTSEAVYGTSTPASVSTDREAPPAVRRPSFLLLRTEESGPRARASTEADAVPRAREGPSPRRLSVASASAATSKSHSDIVKDRSASVSSVPSSSGRPKVMLITRGTRGDIQPFVALARGLILEQNCDVVFVTELPWKKFVKAATEDLPRGRLRFRPCGGDTSRRVSGDLARYVLSLGQQSVALQALVFSRSEVEFFPSEGCFFHWAWEERPTFIVFGFLLIHVAMIISEALQIPIVGFILQPLREIEPSIERTALDELFGPLRRVFAGAKFNAFLQQVMETLPDRYTLRDLRLSRGLAPCPSNILASNQQAEELKHHRVPLIVPVSPLVLGEQVQSLERKGMTLTDFIFLRQNTSQLDDEVSRFIQHAKSEGRQVLAMTFSSMPVGERLMLDIAVTICRQCRSKTEEGKPKPAVIALVGGQPHEEVSPEVQVLQEKRRLLVLRRAVDFGALFPQVDAALLHGGLGVTSEALVAGIPVITSGILLMDQRYWAARIHELGCGSQGVPVNYLLKPPMGSDGEAPVVDLVQQALDQSEGETWRRRAKDVQRRVQERQGDDPDGLRRNAAAVFLAGTDNAAIVRDGYNRRRSCCCVFCRQATCLLRCLQSTVRWLLCFQVPACLLVWIKVIYACLCCRPLRYLFLWLFPRNLIRASGGSMPDRSMSSVFLEDMTDALDP